MRAFSELYKQLNTNSSVLFRQKLIKEYFSESGLDEIISVIELFLKSKPKRLISLLELKKLVRQDYKIPEWLYEESYRVSGDNVETLSNIVPFHKDSTDLSLSYWVNKIEEARKQPLEERIDWISSSWKKITTEERHVFNKLISGTFRINITEETIVQALSQINNSPTTILSYRINTDWESIRQNHGLLLNDPGEEEKAKSPVNFPTFKILKELTHDLINLDQCQIIDNWHGIQIQYTYNNGNSIIWNESGIILNKYFPDLLINNSNFNSFSVSGNIVLDLSKTNSSNSIKNRLSKNKITKKIIDDLPAIIIIDDLIKIEQENIFEYDLKTRMERMEYFFEKNQFNKFSYTEPLNLDSISAINQYNKSQRKNHYNGLIIRNLNAKYLSFKHNYILKPEIKSIKVALTYAQRGDRRQSNKFSEYTFAVYHKDEFITLSKCALNLNDAEMEEILIYVQKNIMERFGPVYAINPKLVFELEFESASQSKRHKSGYKLVNPKIKSWLKENDLASVTSLKELKKIIS